MTTESLINDSGSGSFSSGIGIGGDYPMSAAVISERGHLQRRGALLAWIFSNQGWGTLAGSICTIIILACFENALNVEGEYGQLDAVWRIQMGLPLVPALAVLPFRLTMPEGKKYLQSQELNHPESSPVDSRMQKELKRSGPGSQNLSAEAAAEGENAIPATEQPQSTKAKWDTFIVYFKEWHHLKTLIGTASTWFLLDIAFYGVNLNQSVILTEIGFSKGRNEYHTLMRNAIGNLIIAVAGYVPGYFVTVALVEVLGRKWIQIQGFLCCALLFGVLAGNFYHMGTAAKFVCFALAQVSDMYCNVQPW
jgi:PHS family inorganic phosphate transporter-like MFS transporter